MFSEEPSSGVPSANDDADEEYSISASFPVCFLRRDFETKYVQELQEDLRRGSRRVSATLLTVNAFISLVFCCGIAFDRIHSFSDLMDKLFERQNKNSNFDNFFLNSKIIHAGL